MATGAANAEQGVSRLLSHMRRQHRRSPLCMLHPQHTLRTPLCYQRVSIQCPRPSAQSSSIVLPLRRRFASSSTSSTAPQPPPPLPPSSSPSSSSPPLRVPPSSAAARAPNPLSYSTAAELSPAELDFVLTSARLRRSSLSSQSSELQALQAELQAEVELDRQLAALTLSQRIVRRLKRRQLGWKLLAVLLAIAAMVTSLQLLALKQRHSEEREKGEVHLALLREGVERSEAEAADVADRLLGHLTQTQAALIARGGVDSTDARWVEALRERLQLVDGEVARSAEEVKVRQQVAALEQRLAGEAPQP